MPDDAPEHCLLPLDQHAEPFPWRARCSCGWVRDARTRAAAADLGLDHLDATRKDDPS